MVTGLIVYLSRDHQRVSTVPFGRSVYSFNQNGNETRIPSRQSSGGPRCATVCQNYLDAMGTVIVF
jgi:hypothetical protein